jgi:hypothetical protein
MRLLLLMLVVTATSCSSLKEDNLPLFDFDEVVGTAKLQEELKERYPDNDIYIEDDKRVVMRGELWV